MGSGGLRKRSTGRPIVPVMSTRDGAEKMAAIKSGRRLSRLRLHRRQVLFLEARATRARALGLARARGAAVRPPPWIALVRSQHSAQKRRATETENKRDRRQGQENHNDSDLYHGNDSRLPTADEKAESPDPDRSTRFDRGHRCTVIVPTSTAPLPSPRCEKVALASDEPSRFEVRAYIVYGQCLSSVEQTYYTAVEVPAEGPGLTSLGKEGRTCAKNI